MLELADASTDWLRRLPGTVQRNDLASTYGFDHVLNAERVLMRQQVSLDGSSFRWQIMMRNASGQDVLTYPLTRDVYARTELQESAELGPIAYNASFDIQDAYKEQGLAKLVYQHEDMLYRRWGLREIHMTAVRDGLVVWIKRFGFRPVNPGVLAVEYEGWARRQNFIGPVTDDPRTYPDEFLRSRMGLDLFKVLRCDY